MRFYLIRSDLMMLSELNSEKIIFASLNSCASKLMNHKQQHYLEVNSGFQSTYLICGQTPHQETLALTEFTSAITFCESLVSYRRPTEW